MYRSKGPRRPRPPLDDAQLRELAMAYVGRFATSRAKLAAYLDRKLRERGWAGPQPPDSRAVSDRMAELGFIDDAGYALAKARGLGVRGYGKRRVIETLKVAGIADADSAGARDHADAEAAAAALRFAQRRRIGPFATEPVDDPRQRQRTIAAMIRAGHSFAFARAIVEMAPEPCPDADLLAERLRFGPG